MKSRNHTYQRIEDYLNGNMSAAEKDAFEKQLAENEALQKQVKLQKLASELVIENRLLKVKELVAKEKAKNSQSQWKNIFTGVLLTAAVTGSAYVYFGPTEKPSVENNKTKKETQIKESKKEKTLGYSDSQNAGPVKETENTDIQTAAPKKEKTTAPKKVKKQRPAPSVLDTQEPKKETQKEKKEAKQKIAAVDTLHLKEVQDEEKNDTIEQNASKLDNIIVEKLVEPCDTANIQASLNTKNACENEENGQIRVSEIKGGHDPYEIKVFDDSGEEVASYSSLPNGNYKVVISDGENCSKTFNTKVKATLCSKDYAFNPYFGEEWEIPTRDQYGVLQIFNNQGLTVYQKNIPANNQLSWDGTSERGNLKEGYYIFTIKYDDGKTLKGSVTILR
ncbi:gliding motility-associated C-terminal domain-containing protein [Cytophagaceae bacterium ABcell3]|nr:gliding motility-associated C-terminal domain-containing protein [Cytophagaceae bacterium ABcell3]